MWIQWIYKKTDIARAFIRLKGQYEKNNSKDFNQSKYKIIKAIDQTDRMTKFWWKLM